MAVSLLFLICEGLVALALASLVSGLLSLRQLWRQPWVGWSLRCRAGNWSWLEPQGPLVPLREPPVGLCLPHTVQLRWRCNRGRRHALWLFPDSADPQQLRQLRRAIRLGRAAGATG